MQDIQALISQGQQLINSAKAVEEAVTIKLPQPEPGSDRATIWTDCNINGEFSVYELETELQKLVEVYSSQHERARLKRVTEQAWFSWLLWVLFDQKIVAVAS
jgi:hypothetical protein